jgi:gliding motility associated protien GldN
MKRKIILILFLMLTVGSTLMAQTKKKGRTVRRKSTKTVSKTSPKGLTKDTSMVAQSSATKDTALHLVPNKDDGFYKSSVIAQARPFPLIEPDPNNIRIYHRYWRDIDLKDPKNAKFAIPGATLIEALLKAIKEGKIVAYDPLSTPSNPTGDAFVNPMTYNQLMGHMRDTAIVNKLDKDGNIIGSQRALNDFSPDKVVAYRIKEDVYFDKQRSKVETRIIGIAPVITIKTSNGDTLNRQPVCWLKFQECRKVFSTLDVSDPDKNLYDVSMDDMFMQRQFNAKIIEESNPRGERIKDYIKDPAAQDAESQRIERKLANYKKGIWDYKTSESLTPTNAANDPILNKASKRGRKTVTATGASTQADTTKQ